ncbi:hypothetical protein [Mammaliicoccus stepanovicii]|uniref:Uncharacterized protein n=1 Tax=Mammaliicoccus stepanovicii TaxID=643214 RepID=A0A239YDQ9_9STAP|nr:hypothetical protein [Mammaliicoccus stepanovicii]PNZ75552.1 hypothetical protein CD111_07695 [Mammaliicoccus stepanovicii]GGI42651.1 hypothetical protein GCM10010896_19480 [Mammaliicoccus stepanovicii]SNV56832.1 Uncharacterised protein [Mammaliicoccus stepanovicii]
MENNQYKLLLDEIEKLKFHNTSLLTLIGLLHTEDMKEPTIQETVVLFDLSKKDLREFSTLIKNYNGNNFALEQKALKINPIFKRRNIISILKSFIISEMFQEKSQEILNSYE